MWSPFWVGCRKHEGKKTSDSECSDTVQGLRTRARKVVSGHENRRNDFCTKSVTERCEPSKLLRNPIVLCAGHWELLKQKRYQPYVARVRSTCSLRIHRSSVVRSPHSEPHPVLEGKCAKGSGRLSGISELIGREIRQQIPMPSIIRTPLPLYSLCSAIIATITFRRG
jgi:hypothetical protein